MTPGVTYPLAESGGQPAPTSSSPTPTPNLIPGSTGQLELRRGRTDGTTVIPGFSDGLNGGVTVPFGTWVRCTAINETSTIQLRKLVINYIRRHRGAVATGRSPPRRPGSSRLACRRSR